MPFSLSEQSGGQKDNPLSGQSMLSHGQYLPNVLAATDESICSKAMRLVEDAMNPCLNKQWPVEGRGRHRPVALWLSYLIHSSPPCAWKHRPWRQGLLKHSCMERKLWDSEPPLGAEDCEAELLAGSDREETSFRNNEKRHIR